jgi:hypothetical protein
VIDRYVGQPLTDAVDLAAVERELFLVGVSPLSHVSDENEALQAEDEIVKLAKT